MEVRTSGTTTPVRSGTPNGVLPLEREEYQDTLRDLRNMSEFAEFVQFLSFFKGLFKISEPIDIEVIEEELLNIAIEPRIIPKAQEAVITQLIRQKRILTGPLDDLNVAAWHLYASRKFLPEENPMGPSTAEGELADLNIMDPSIRVTILYTFCRWIAIDDTFHDKIDKLVAAGANNKNSDEEPLTPQSFKVDPVGWRGDFGVYYLLDDNRLYYFEDKEPDLSQVDPKDMPGYVPPKETKSKKRARPYSGSGSRKRRSRAAARKEPEEDAEPEAEPEAETPAEEETEYISYAEAVGRDTPIENTKWECICVTLADWTKFIESLRTSKLPYDKMFYKYLKNELLPVLEEHEERRVRDAWAREKQRDIAKLVLTRKKSSRLEEKQVRMEQRAEEERRNAEEQRKRMEARRQERERRDMLSAREARLRLRDEKRERQKEKLVNQHLQAAQEAEDGGNGSRRSSRSSSPASGGVGRSTRSSSRVNKSGAAVVAEGLRRLGKVTDKWDFDCTCGIYGTNYDDGTAVVGCDQCDLWMHVKCIEEEEDREQIEAAFEKARQDGVTSTTYESEFKYVCERCIRLAREKADREEYEREVAAHKQKLKEQQQARKAAKALKKQQELEAQQAAEAAAAAAQPVATPGNIGAPVPGHVPTGVPVQQVKTETPVATPQPNYGMFRLSDSTPVPAPVPPASIPNGNGAGPYPAQAAPVPVAAPAPAPVKFENPGFPQYPAAPAAAPATNGNHAGPAPAVQQQVAPQVQGAPVPTPTTAPSYPQPSHSFPPPPPPPGSS